MRTNCHAAFLAICSVVVAGASCTNTINQPGPLSQLVAFPKSITLDVGNDTAGTVIAADAQSHELPSAAVVWRSSNPQAATVDSVTGRIHAVRIGQASVTAFVGSTSSNPIAVDVTAPVSAIVLIPNPDTLIVGQQGTLSDTLKDAQGDALQGPTVTWSSSDTTVAKVDPQSGTITGVRTGTAVIRALSEGVSDSSSLSVVVAFASMSVGSTHSCAVTMNGVGYCWGFNANGELGDGVQGPQVCTQNAYCSTTPVPVAPPSGSTAPLVFRTISAGQYSTCGVTTDGNLWCWGYIAARYNIPVQVPLSGVSGSIKVLSVGGNSNDACITTDTQATYCMGSDVTGQLGVPRSNAPSFGTTLIQVVEAGNLFDAVAADLSVGGAHACASVYLGNSYCWGSDQYGQLGLGGLADSACTTGGPSFDCAVTPTAIPTPNQFNQIAAGDAHTCGLDINDLVYCWGHNEQLELGNTTIADSTMNPIAIPSTAGQFTMLSAGGGLTCGLDHSGHLFCWGGFPIGYPHPQPNPTQLPLPGSQAAVSLSAGGLSVCVLTHAGAIYCSGQNDIGQLGDGNLGDLITMTRVLAPAPPGGEMAARVVKRLVRRMGTLTNRPRRGTR